MHSISRLRATLITAFAITLACASSSAQTVTTQNQDPITVIAAPLTGTYKPLGDLFLAALGAISLDTIVVPIDTACNGERAVQAAMEILALEPKSVVGLPCIDTFDAIAPALAGASIPTTIVGLQTPDVTANSDGLIRRVAPTSRQIYRRLANHLAETWRDVPFAIVDDGTLSGRQLAEEVGALLAEASLTPVFRDTYRPLLSNQAALVRRLERAGTRHVILGGDGFDAIVIGNDARRLNVELTIAGDDNLLSPQDEGVLPDGTLIAGALPLVELIDLAYRSLSASADGQTLAFDANGEPLDDLTVLNRIENGTPVSLPVEQTN